VNAVLASNIVCFLLYAVLALLLAIHWRGRPTGLLLLVACTITSCWALAASIDAGWEVGRAASGALETLRGGGWFACLAWVYRAGLQEGAGRRQARSLVLGSALLCLILVAIDLRFAASNAQTAQGLPFFALVSGRLLLAVGGLALATTFLRQATPATREAVKHLCIGVGALFAFDLFVYSEALLFRRVDPILASSRGAVSALVAPLVAVAAARNPVWSVNLYVSRNAVFLSAVLVGAGIYMLGLAAAGSLLRAIGGQWGLVLQIAFFFGAAILLAVLLFSENLKTLLKRQIRRHFFRARYDYREEWLRFVTALSSTDSDADLRQRALRAATQIVESTGAGLWLLEEDAFSLAARFRFPDAEEHEPCPGPFADQLELRSEAVLELCAPGDAGVVQMAPWVPEWLRRCEGAWLVLPLPHRGRVIGFIVLLEPSLPRSLSPEDAELMPIVARQVASYLAEEQAIRALHDASRFQEFSRRVAFFAHDLRNLAHELTLALANSRKHIQNEEFQRDLLALLEDSVSSLQRLLDQLGGNAADDGGRAHTDLVELLASSVGNRFSDKPPIELDLGNCESLPVSGDRERLVAVTGHLIRNATNAAGRQGHVGVTLRRDGREAIFEVVDDGPGMTAEFLRERLHHPFHSSTSGGYGLGLYQCRRLARELGGGLEIDSEQGRGTVARLRLPLLESADEAPMRARHP
jgi:putative PEP-CTERM system histidine kinase